MTTIAETLTPGLDRLPPVFASCVRSDNKRCARPFVIDGLVYATNGHLCVRMPAPEGWDIPNPEHVIEKAGHVFQGTFEQEPLALPAIEVEACKACHGAKVLPERLCGRCMGAGRVSVWCDCPKCDGSHSCEVCEGDGIIPAGDCTDCRRTGVEGNSYERVEVSKGVYLAHDYVMMLVQQEASLYLPVWDVPELYGLAREKGSAPLRFTVGDVEGRIMPMTPPGSEDSWRN